MEFFKDIGKKDSEKAQSIGADTKILSDAMSFDFVPIEKIKIGDNIRELPEDHLPNGIKMLMNSIDAEGLLQPPTGHWEDNFFVIDIGSRRMTAIKCLYKKNPCKWNTVPCLLNNDVSKNRITKQLVENFQRAGISQKDLFISLCALRDQGLTNAEIAHAIGKKEGYVKQLFVGINELLDNFDLLDIFKSYAGITFDDITVTKDIHDQKDRFDLLQKREKKEITRKQLRSMVREIKKQQLCIPPSEEHHFWHLLPPTETEVTIRTNKNYITVYVFDRAKAEDVAEKIRKFLKRDRSLYIKEDTPIK
jgi:hypothetical protein